MRKIVFGILIFLTSSCSKNATPISPVSVTNQSIIVVTATQGPFTTPLIPDSETESSSLKEINFTPTLIPADIPEQLLAVYELPDWMRNLNTPILVALLDNQISGSRKIAFFNAETGEEFELGMPKNINGYFWYDAQNFGLLSKNLKTAYKLNLLTGKVSSQEVNSEAVRLLDPEWHHGLEIITETNGEYTFDDAWNHENSKDKNFTAVKTLDWDGIVVTNNLTNEVVWGIATPKDVYINEFSWSPADNNILAYVQGKPDTITTDFIVRDVNLNIVDVTTGEIQATYSGDFGRIEWSPDGKMILFQNAASRYSNYGVGFLDAPCILFISSNDRKCLLSIPKRIPTEYELASTGIYTWEPAHESIFFIYLYWSSEKRKYAGELCEYSLINSNINCLTENLKELDERSAGSYSLSPSKEYIYFCISDSSILNDYADNSNDGVMKIDGTGYFSWVSIVQDGGPSVCTFDELWRPLP